MSDIKPGRYVVEVTLVPDRNREGQQMAYVASPIFKDWRIPADCLHPLPAATISAEAQAVLDAAVANVELLDAKFPGDEWNDDNKPFADAVYAYRASIASPDPVAELVAAAKALHNENMEYSRINHLGGENNHNVRRVRAALAAVEAARGAK